MTSQPEFSEDPPFEVGALEGWEAPIPDEVDEVIEADAMVSVFLADRYRRIERMRRTRLADAARHGYQLTEVIERSIRLELAAALSVTEFTAGGLLAQADALVNRYPSALHALAGARITQRHATELAAALDAVEPEFHERLLAPALALAENNPVGKFRRKLRDLVERVRATTLQERHERALQTRLVHVDFADDGMAVLTARIPAV